MSATLAFVHTLVTLADYFDRLAKELLPEVRPLHLVDEPLLARIRERGRLLPADTERLASHIAIAAETGAQAVLVTCSTLSPGVGDAARESSIPVVKIDEAMLEEAVRRGPRVGIIATNPATVGPSRDGLLAKASEAGVRVETEEAVIEEALDALIDGDADTHDELIVREAAALEQRCDVVMLAQASMARAVDLLPAEIRGHVLTSPHTAMNRVAEFLG